MSLSSFISRVVPATIGYATGGPVGAVTAIARTEQGKAQERKVKRDIARQQQALSNRRREYMAMGSGEFGTPGLNFTQTQPQQMGFFERLGNIGSNVGNTLLTGLEAALPGVISSKVFGIRPGSSGQQPAITTVTNVGAQESQGSGSIEAGAGSLLPSLLSGARSLLKTPGGQLALGGGIGLATTMVGPDGKKMRITRKMKSQARTVVNIAGGNLSLAADILNISQEMLITILLKRFRNDGPVVTKAALRKTKQTVRRLHNMQDVLKSITPTATMRRRAPMRRATTTTLIKN